MQKVLLDDMGLNYVCATAERFYAVSTVLTNMLNAMHLNPSVRLLKHIVRCYLRLSDNHRAREALREDSRARTESTRRATARIETEHGTYIIELPDSDTDPIWVVDHDETRHHVFPTPPTAPAPPRPDPAPENHDTPDHPEP